MKEILNAVREANMSIIIILSSILTLLVVIFVLIVLQGMAKEYSFIQWVFLIICALIIIAIIVVFLFQRIFIIMNFENSREHKELAHLSYVDEFNSSIETEMGQNLLAEYKNKNYKMHIFITSRWFIFISKNGSIIRKNEDIARIYAKTPQFGFSDYSLDILVIEFFDGSSFQNSCFLAIDEIISICKEQLPNVDYTPR